MSEHPEVPGYSEPTSLGQTAKLFNGTRTVLVQRDLSDFDQVFELAHKTTLSSDRIIMKRTVAETRAIAELAVTAGVIASRVAQIINLMDGGASKDVIVEKLDQLGEFTRPLTVKRQ